ncbi:DNA-binding protein [Hymenobacter aquaticus]|uniref:DNA-binding protein n=1 Tax=Hymenobacter aquaticus TaxID=1867101 RepID=A0A4Z0Q6Z2_9BACT|nr:DNA-binding protein [Hymenobacter aquaticus]TGE25189.1 DNA-binding protein [Hymenobacter aquaticus]
MKLLLISSKKLGRLISEIIDEGIRLLLQEVQISQPKEGYSAEETVYLTTKQALAYLHISKPTLNKLRRQGLVRGLRVSDKRVLCEKSN